MVSEPPKLLAGPNLDDFRDVMPQHVLDPGLQGSGRTRAARAGPLHVQIDDAVFEPAENDVAAVLGYSRTDAGLDQLLDLGDDLIVLALAFSSGVGSGLDDRPAGREVLHDDAE